jgi:DNA-binding HxlR family transcriptional regulator
VGDDLAKKKGDPLHTIETLMILKTLLRDEKHFSGIERETKLSKSTVANRLKLLIEKGLVEKRPVRGFPPKVMYRLTEHGREFYDKLLEVELKPRLQKCAERIEEGLKQAEHYALLFPEEVHKIYPPIASYLKLLKS